MKSTNRQLFFIKIRSTIILLMILQVVHSIQIDFYENRVSIFDCLNADKKDVELFLQKDDEDSKGVVNHRAKFILSELFMSSERNVTLSMTSDGFYSFHRHQHAVKNTIFTLAPKRSLSIMIITTNCPSNSRHQFEILLKDHFVYCHSLNLTLFYPLGILESFNVLSVEIAVLILPRLLIQAFLEIAAKFQADSFIYITVENEPKMIRNIQEINPLLAFYNLNLFNASDLFKNEMKRRINQTECSLSAGKIFYQDDYQIFVCQHPLPRILQIVTISFTDDVFPLPNIYPRQGKCEIGLPCKRRSRARKISRDTKHEMELACCGGRMIDRLMIIIDNIKIPFSMYLVEDGHYGSFFKSSWDGLVDDLYTGKADLAVAPLSVTRERFRLIDYVYDRSKRTPMAILLRRPDIDVEFTNFSFIPRDGKDIIAFLVLLHLAVFLFVYAFERIAFHQHYGQKYNFKDSWSFVSAILFQRDLGGLATIGWGGRILAITYACGMTILISTYTATLTAGNFDYEDIPQFQGLRDKMFQDPSKRVGLARYSSHENIVDKYHHKSQRINVIEYEKAAGDVIEKNLDAVIGSIWELDRAFVSDTDYCKYLILHIDEIETEDLAWGFQDNSKFGNLISLSIKRLMETKSFDQIEERWSTVNACEQKRPKQYPWQYAGGLIICLLVTIGACVIMLVSETIFILLRKMKARSYSVSN